LPKALIAVDLYGQCADYDRITEACDEFGVAIIEDAAEALGGQYRGRSAGTLGAIGILSFNGNKIITTAGGGMLLSDDPAYTQRARFLSTQAREAPFPHYEHRTVGYNYRLSNLLAAVGVGQLQYLQDRVASRRRIFNRYKQLLGGVPGIEFMPEAEYGVSNRWLTCVTVDPERFGATREDIRVFLESHNIESRPLWKPMHLQPAYQSWPIVGGTVASSLFEQGLCLPSGSALTDAEIDMIGSLIMTVAETRNVARSQ
jgi:pyridoxal phosphate-dependent aminotransferase EpsN